MKQNTHPDYHEVTIAMTDGTEFKTRTTWGKPGDRMQLDIDSKTHPAWTGQHRLVDRGTQLAKFNRRFAGIAGTKGEETAAPVAAAAAPATEEKIKLTTTVAKAAPAKKKKA